MEPLKDKLFNLIRYFYGPAEGWKYVSFFETNEFLAATYMPLFIIGPCKHVALIVVVLFLIILSSTYKNTWNTPSPEAFSICWFAKVAFGKLLICNRNMWFIESKFTVDASDSYKTCKVTILMIFLPTFTSFTISSCMCFSCVVWFHTFSPAFQQLLAQTMILTEILTIKNN